MAPSVSQGLKVTLFVSLTLVTTANIVCMNLSRTLSPGEEAASLYYSSTSVFLVELVKIMLSIVLLFVEVGSISNLVTTIQIEVLHKWQDTLKLSVPAIVYVIQNNLSFIALGNLDPATYQVTYQLKLLTTALVMRVLLGKILSAQQWGALFVLLFGVCLVQLEKISPFESTHLKDSSGDLTQSATLAPNHSTVNVITGISATLGMTFCSAFAGVYFEKMVRSNSNSNGATQSPHRAMKPLSDLGMLWIKNIQLYLFSCSSALLACAIQDSDKILANGFFHGYNTLTIVVVLISSAGGTATALMLKYLDNIYKNFASSMSLVLASVCSFFLTGQLYGFKFFLGGFLVCTSLFIYQNASAAAAPKKLSQPYAPKALSMHYPDISGANDGSRA